MKIDRRNDLSLRLLEIFGAVMRCQTTVGAAEDLGISQPAVSNGIRALESQLGFMLFERTSRQLRPTEEARLLLREIEPIFSALRGIENEVRNLRAAKSGRLRLIATPPLGHTALPYALRNFLDDRENVTVRFDIRRLDTVVQAVEMGTAEIGFLLGIRQHPELTVTRLCESTLVCVMQAGHPLENEDVITPEKVADHSLIGLESTLGASVRSAFGTAGIPMRSKVEVRYCHTACILANAGIGVAVVDPFSAHFAKSLDVVTKPFEPKTNIVAAALTRKDIPLSLLASQFIDEVRVQLSQVTAESEA
ncbi:MAG: transcriptional regulator [Hyphomicrobiales bacterium]|nr:MAG: transcriptional regulator [Hyphomicrobiales bacterium]